MDKNLGARLVVGRRNKFLGENNTCAPAQLLIKSVDGRNKFTAFRPGYTDGKLTGKIKPATNGFYRLRNRH